MLKIVSGAGIGGALQRVEVELGPKTLAQRICLKRSKNVILGGSYLSSLGADLPPHPEHNRVELTTLARIVSEL